MAGGIKYTDYRKLIILLVLMTVIIPVVIFGSTYLRNMPAVTAGEPIECTVVRMHTEYETRNSRYITTFMTDDGTELDIDTTYKDHIGRKTVLIVHGKNGVREHYEIPKLTAGRIICLGLLILMWFTMIYCRAAGKLTIIKEE